MMKGMGNMQKMMKQMQKMQKDMQKAQEELAEKTVEGTAGGGMVTVVINGQKQVIDVNIKEDVVDPEDIEMLQDLVLAATNDALKQMDDLTNNTMGQFTKGLNIPGL
ncbi:YbaB/EbfC family nucleoid-associated protein [Priestia aryabhattai]|uniref:YbaB/EbfC family nucleoid-associated protein n=1 Tax=Priestia aryabhattai TaxID=412384 RepID=UPI001ED7B8FB|nr:YbaB/EbfC family nucleoid-associated protein [Priestia aryabhattai]MBY0094268.1 YbaB/EbfC family nucleoid-associated protein [Priestia aryabhattai]MBY0104731.1 YbaB/EbfC family nucleoid-associated protein [Priestia aryabhattai]